MMKFLCIVMLLIIFAGCTLVSMTTQVTVGNDDMTEDTTQDSENLDLSPKPLL